MAYSDNFPAQRPSFIFDAANSGRIPPNATFSRPDSPINSSNAPASAVHYWSNEKHLSSENLFVQSSDFDTTWYNQGLSAKTGGQTDPSGGTDGFTLVEDGTAAFHRLSQSPTATGELALTVYAKRNSGTRYLNLTFGSSGGGSLGSALATFDLAGGATHTANGSNSTLTNLSATQTSSGNGYYKCVFKATASASIATAQISLSDTATPVANNYGLVYYTGDGTSSIDVAFASLSTTGATDYNATTTQLHREYAPTLKSVSTAGQPRFEYSPTDSASEVMGQSRGLLIEGSSTNLLAGSATIGGAYWGVVNATAQQNTAVAPDGTLTATTLVENSAGGAKYAYSNNYTPAGSTTYTFSAFVKPNGRNFCMIYTNLGGASQSSMFDLVTGSTSNLSGSGTNQATQCGNGWWRLSVTVTTSSTTTANFQILPATDATTFDYTGNGYSGLICWGAMLEQSSFASSYIGTTSSAVTRASDSASVDLSAINQDPIGTDIALATEFRCNVVDTNFRRIAEMRRSSGSGLHKSHQVYNGTAYSYATDTSGTNQVLKSIVSLGDSSHKLVSTQSGASAFAAGDGVAGNTKTSTAEDMVYDRLYIGSDGAGVRQLDGHISRIALYGNSISETNATALSS
jgi:hypothetical protein